MLPERRTPFNSQNAAHSDCSKRGWRPPTAALSPQVPTDGAKHHQGRNGGQDEAFLFVDERAVEDEKQEDGNRDAPPLGSRPFSAVKGAPQNQEARRRDQQADEGQDVLVPRAAWVLSRMFCVEGDVGPELLEGFPPHEQIGTLHQEKGEQCRAADAE